MLAQAHELVRPGGWLRIDCGGGDNVARLTAWLDPISARYGGPATPWTFLGAGTYLGLLADAGFDVSLDGGGWVRTTAQHRPFDRASITGWLTSQCLAAYQAGMAPEHREPFAAEALDRLDELAAARRHLRPDLRPPRRAGAPSVDRSRRLRTTCAQLGPLRPPRRRLSSATF